MYLRLKIERRLLPDGPWPVVCSETVANAIRELAAQSHFDLVETFADRIADLCLADPRVRTADVQVEKPLAIPDTKGAGVRVVRER